MKNPAAQLARDAVHWHYPHYHHDRPASAIRARDWNLIEYLDGSGDVELYHINKDVGEKNNLVQSRRGVTASLQQKLRAWRTSVAARMPLPNLAHDPKRAKEWYSPRTGRPVPSDKRRRFPPG